MTTEMKYYCDTETGTIFEESDDGIFALKRINGRKERIPVEEIPASAQLLFGNAHRIWDYVR